MTDKIILNIVYSPQDGPSAKVFENEDGEIWNSPHRVKDMINIGMGWYSIKKPVRKEKDCLLVVEPFCVLDRDYDVNFASKFDKIFTWAIKGFKDPRVANKVVEINHPSFHNFPTAEEASKNWLPWKDRKNEIVLIANNKTSKHHSELYSLRIQIADMFHKSGFEVSWYGQIPIKKPYYKGKADNKQEILRKAKFSMCCENSYDPDYSHGYFSEKLPDVWKSGAMPLYMGCFNVDDFDFFDGSYIDLRKYVKKEERQHKINQEALLNKLKSITEEDHAIWATRVKNEIINSKPFRDQISFKKAYETMLKSFK